MSVLSGKNPPYLGKVLKDVTSKRNATAAMHCYKNIFSNYYIVLSEDIFSLLGIKLVFSNT